MSRFVAAFYHLLLSLAVIIFPAYLVLFIWYPDFFYTIDGGREGMRIIIAVNLVMGPLLTLIVFKAGKPGLKLDLTVIGLVQAACLIAGTWVVYEARPLFFVYYENAFYSANAETFARFNQPVPDPGHYSDSTPAMVIATVPADPIEEADFRQQLYVEGVPIWIYADSYEPLTQHSDRLMSRGFPVAKLQQRDSAGRLEAFLAQHGGAAADYLFLPAYSRYQNPFIAIRRADQQIVDVLRVDSPPATLPDPETKTKTEANAPED